MAVARNSSGCRIAIATVAMMLLLLLEVGSSSGGSGLSADYYAQSCPRVTQIVREGMEEAIRKETRMGASVLRLLFHDCFVQGCDASLLLDNDTAHGIVSEKGSVPNQGSARGFNVVDNIKAALERECPGTVSCSDILALAARETVTLSGGLGWEVRLGRRDSTTASLSGSNNNIPAPNSTLATLINKFKAQGMNQVDLVALSGGHTIGQSRCTSFRQRLYNQTGNGRPDAALSESLLQKLRKDCPALGRGGDNNLFPLDHASPTVFDNAYFASLLAGHGLLNSDAELVSNSSSLRSLVALYAHDDVPFLQQFAASMRKMSEISPLLAPNGQVRLHCNSVNSS